MSKYDEFAIICNTFQPYTANLEGDEGYLLIYTGDSTGKENSSDYIDMKGDLGDLAYWEIVDEQIEHDAISIDLKLIK